MSFKGEKNFSHEDKEKIGILICNLGTPDSYSVSDVRIFLREFLSDKRVIELPRIIWWFILNFFILTLRPFKSAKIYKSVWTDEGSPLLIYSKRLKEKLDRSSPDNLCFELGMRYGNPSIKSALENLKNKNCRKILVLPLFPQYSATTTGSIFDEVTKVMSTWRWVPSLNFINSYHDNDDFIDAISCSIKSKLEEINPHKIIFTYQYENLQKLYTKYNNEDFVILGFPSRDFMYQEYNEEEKVKEFCNSNYGVSFPLFATSSVKGDKANDFYKSLNAKTGKTPSWNFTKILISKNGKETHVFSSNVEPDDLSILSKIEKLL